MRKAPIDLQDLRRRIYVKAKAEPLWRFWGLYVHVCKTETLLAAYQLTKENNGAPGIDGVTFEVIEADGVESFVEQLRQELVAGTYRPMRVRKVEIPKGDHRVRVLSIPAIRDRVVQGALKLILEPIFEADFQPGSFAVTGDTMKVNSTEFGSITIDGETYHHDVLIRLSGKIRKRKKKLSKRQFGTSHIMSLEEAKFVHEKGSELLVLGTGQNDCVRLSPEAAALFARKGCKVLPQATPHAVATFNRAKGRWIALFHVTC